MKLLMVMVGGLALLYLVWLVPDFVVWVLLLLVAQLNSYLAPYGVVIDMSWLTSLYSWIRILAQVMPVAIVALVALIITVSIFEKR